MPFNRWLGKLTKLNKARDNAPHKPLLLLVFLEVVENGDFVGGSLPLTPELAYRFDTFFNVVQYRRTARPDVRMPFHHLKSDGFWSAHMASGELSDHRSTTAYVVPDPEFVEACHDPEFRRQARGILIATHFEPAERNALYHLVGIAIPTADEVTRTAFFETENDAENAGRSARPTRYRLGLQLHLLVDRLPSHHDLIRCDRRCGTHSSVRQFAEQRPEQWHRTLLERALAVRRWIVDD